VVAQLRRLYLHQLPVDTQNILHEVEVPIILHNAIAVVLKAHPREVGTPIIALLQVTQMTRYQMLLIPLAVLAMVRKLLDTLAMSMAAVPLFPSEMEVVLENETTLHATVRMPAMLIRDGSKL